MKLRRKQAWETWRSYLQYVTHELVIAYEPLEREVDKLRAEVAELSGYVSQLQTHMKHQLEHRHQLYSEQGGTLGPIYPKKEPEEVTRKRKVLVKDCRVRLPHGDIVKKEEE